MKKLMCMMLVIAMVITILPVSFAAEDSELTKVVKIAKERLQIPEELTEFYSNGRDAVGQKTYDLSWSTAEDVERRREIDATILSTGEILSYNYYDSGRERNKIGFAPFTEDEYIAKAKSFAERVNPSYVSEIAKECTANIGTIFSSTVSVKFNREKNGIPVDGNYISVTLDKYTGEITYMHSYWTREKEIKTTDGIITNEEAAKILGEKSELKLRYYKLRDKNHAVLMYTPEKSYMMIDAFTGEDFEVEFIDAEIEETGGAGGGSAEAPMASDNATAEKNEVSLTDKEIEAVDEFESLYTKEALTAIIRRMSNTEIASFDVKTVDYRLVEMNGKKHYIATLRLEKDDNKTGTVTINAETGELLSFSTYLPYRTKTQKVKFERMEANALQFIRTWAPETDGKAKNFDENQNSEYFYFTHNENGIEYYGNTINIRVDKETGRILSFSKSWDRTITFDSPEGIITTPEAAAKYTEAAPPELLYIANKRVRYASNNAEELALIYRLPSDAPYYIDAKTGAAYDWNMGQSERENPDKYVLQKDLDGHWAKDIIKTLADNGIIISYEENFRPDEALTQKEFTLLTECFDGGARPYAVPESEYGWYMQRLINRGVIKESERNPGKKLTREEIVTYLVRMSELEEVAEMRGIFKTGFSDEADISKDKIGYVALAKGMGFVSGNGGKFNPKKQVTRAEFAAMLYNSLVN